MFIVAQNLTLSLQKKGPPTSCQYAWIGKLYTCKINDKLLINMWIVALSKTSNHITSYFK
jgi:hypothetical protein